MHYSPCFFTNRNSSCRPAYRTSSFSETSYRSTSFIHSRKTFSPSPAQNLFVVARDWKLIPFPIILALPDMELQPVKPATRVFPTRKANKTYQKYLGKMVGKLASKHLRGYSAPEYLNSSHYARTGNTIVLWADESYYKLYPEDPERVFRHHFHQPYIYLASRLNDAAPDVPGQELAGR